MAELDADDQASLDFTTRIGQDGKGALIFPGDVSFVIREFPSVGTVHDSEWVMFEHETVEHAHRLYHDVGADVALTFTSRCSAPTLAKEDTGVRMEDVNAHAARLAFQSACPFVLGTLGPSCLDDSESEDDAVRAYEEQARVLLGKGVHGFYLDDMRDLRHLKAAAQGAQYAAHARELGAYRSVVACVRVGHDQCMEDGTTIEDAIKAAADLELAALGVDCLDCATACALAQPIADAAKGAGIAAMVRIAPVTDSKERTERSRSDAIDAVVTAAGELERVGIRLLGPGHDAGPEMVGIIADALDQVAL